MPRHITDEYGNTPKMKRFCEEYAIHLNQQKAFDAAGYKGYKEGPSGVFRLPSVQAYLKVLMGDMANKNKLTAERVLEEISRMAFSNIVDYYKKKGKAWVLKDLNELTPEQLAAIEDFKPGKHLKLYSKDQALDKLGKHLKLYTDIDPTVNNLVIMPTLRISGKEVVFEVGKPAPKITAQNKID